MFKYKLKRGTKKSLKLVTIFLSGLISFSPIITIIACNKKNEIKSEHSDNNKNIELFNIIKSKISATFSDAKTKVVLDKDDLNLGNEALKSLLNPIFEKAKNNKEEISVNDNRITHKIIEKIKNIINDLNIKLKTIPALENSSNIISLNGLNARMNGSDIKTLIKLIDQKQYSLVAENAGPDFDYNLQLNLDFKINIANKENNYIYNDKSAFITSNKKNLDIKVLNLANKLSTSLAHQELNGKNIIDNALNNNMNYVESFSGELNNILKDKNIKIEKSRNMEINREELSFPLKNLLGDLDSKYLNAFTKLINDSNTAITTIEELFDRQDSEFYQFKNYLVQGDKVFTKNFKEFVITKWSIEGIELPERTLNNIKIYHEKSEINNSWRNFYEILKFYLHPKQRDNLDFNPGAYRIIYRMFNDHAQLREQTQEKRLYQWANDVKKEIKPDYLEKFLINISNIMHKDWTNLFPGTDFERIVGSIQLFSNQLSLFLVDDVSIIFHYKK